MIGLVLALLLLTVSVPAASEDAGPLFETHRHEIAGRIHQVWISNAGACKQAARDLLVLHGVGSAPNEEKRVTWMPCGAGLVPGDPRIVRRTVPPDVAVVDVARVPGRRGPQLVMASVDGLRVDALTTEAPSRFFPIPDGVALPSRPWELTRLPMIDDWHDQGPSTALLPALRGGWLVDLTSGALRSIELPVTATYRTWNPHLPQTEWKWMRQDVRWPSLARGDDDGDGRLDLFALGRFEIRIHHAGPDGIPDEASRRIPLQPFDEETEREPLSTATAYFVRDIDGDARADLLLNTISGGLTSGRSQSRLYLNRGGGIDPSGPPDAQRVVEGGFSNFSLVDVDGDGRDEILETQIEFGVVQLMRFLVTRRAETTVRLLELDPDAPGGLREIFRDDFVFRIDFAEGTIRGLLPSLGDWNGDGLLDFHLQAGDDAIAFRMGSNEPGRPLFGRRVGRQPVPISAGQSRVADLDGDGLDEIVAFSTNDPDSPLIVLENLGRLPGSRRRAAPTQ